MPHITEQQQPEIEDQDFPGFIQQHLNMLQTSGIPQVYWPALHMKLKQQMYDAGEFFRMQCYLLDDDEDEDDPTNIEWKVEALSDMKAEDPLNIFLIDHAWTYRPSDARHQLLNIPGILDRMSALMGVKVKERGQEEIIADVLQEMWKYNQTYSFGHLERGSDDSMPFWYVMDEFGSRIHHSDTPNCRMVPFYYAPLKLTYTLMWPTTDIEAEDEVTRNYIEAETDPDKCKVKLLPWQPCDLKDISYKQVEPDCSYFESHRENETLPSADFEFPGLPKDRNVKVYIESYPMLAEHLTDTRFEIVETKEEADVWWLFNHFKDFRGLSEEMPGKMVNQFPFEMVVNLKDILAVVSRRAGSEVEDAQTLDKPPAWFPITYNLQTELVKFASYFQHRQEMGLDNHWICKPWNLARGLDMHITNNLSHIVRLPDSGPKVACKYVEDPVLFLREDIGNVKFDIRYLVFLVSVQPLKLYVYRIFWLRFANKPFSLDHFDDYEKHFTVMNYVEEGTKLKQVHYDDFIPMFDSQYPAYKWETVEESIFQMFRELFQAATAKPCPQGIGHCQQSRAQYAIDLLLKWSKNDKGERTIQPVLCEVNFAPDCDRAMKYHPFFANDLFSTLFLDDPEGHHVTQLL